MTWSPHTFHLFRQFRIPFEILVSSISYILNMLLIYLIMFKSDRRMRDYRKMLMINCLIDIYYNTAAILSMMCTVLEKEHMFLVIDGYFHGARGRLLDFLIFNLMTGFYLIITGVTMQFVFRYIQLTNGNPLLMYSLFGVLVWLSVQNSVLLLKCLETAESATGPSLTALLNSNGLFPENTTTYYVASPKNKMARLQVLHANLIVLLNLSIIAFCGFKIRSHLKKFQHVMSKATQRFQDQLTKVLVLQAIYPFVAMMLPVILASSAVFIGQLRFPLTGFTISTVLSFLPLLNAISVIGLISRFRRAICGGGEAASESGEVTKTHPSAFSRVAKVSAI